MVGCSWAMLLVSSWVWFGVCVDCVVVCCAVSWLGVVSWFVSSVGIGFLIGCTWVGLIVVCLWRVCRFRWFGLLPNDCCDVLV